MTGNEKHKRHRPLDIDSDDNTKEHSNPTLLYGGISDEHDTEGVGEDQDRPAKRRLRMHDDRGSGGHD